MTAVVVIFSYFAEGANAPDRVARATDAARCAGTTLHLFPKR